MNRVVLHLVGSVLLAVFLLCVAELVGRSEAQANASWSSPVEVTPPAPASPARVSLLERCWELVGPKVPAPARVEEPGPRQPYGWGHLSRIATGFGRASNSH